MEASEIVKQLVDRWPSAIVARSDVSKFSGGLLHPRTMANVDSRGVGPAERLVVGRKIAYPTAALAEWMASRTEIKTNKAGE